MNVTTIFEMEREGDILILTPVRDLRELEFQEIQDELYPLVADPQTKKVVIDLGHTDYLGSIVLGMLVRLWDTARSQGGNMVLCNVSAHEREIIQVTGLADLWTIRPSRQAALSALGDLSLARSVTHEKHFG